MAGGGGARMVEYSANKGAFNMPFDLTTLIFTKNPNTS